MLYKKGDKVAVGKGEARRYIDSREYHIDRSTGIGGSDVGSIFSLPPYGCARKLYYEKTFEEPNYPKEENYHMRRGNLLEDVAAQIYREETKRDVRRPNRDFRSLKYPFMIGHVDRVIIDKRKTRNSVPLEIKSPMKPNFFKMKNEGMPDEYNLQLQHYLITMNRPWGSFCIFSSEMCAIHKWDVALDESLMKDIIKGEKYFWSLVETRNPPAQLVDGLDDKRCQRCIYRITCHGEVARYVEPATEYEYLPGLNEVVTQYIELRNDLKESTEQFEVCKKQLKELMYGYQKVRTDSGRVQFEFQSRTGFDSKRFEKDHPELAAEYKKETQFKTLRVYEIK